MKQSQARRIRSRETTRPINQAKASMDRDANLLKKPGKHRPEAESRSGIDPVVQSTLRIREPSPAPWRFEAQVVANETSRRRPGCNHFFDGWRAHSKFHDWSTYAMVLEVLSID
jgi:hypothetical protein